MMHIVKDYLIKDYLIKKDFMEVKISFRYLGTIHGAETFEINQNNIPRNSTIKIFRRNNNFEIYSSAPLVTKNSAIAHIDKLLHRATQPPGEHLIAGVNKIIKELEEKLTENTEDKDYQEKIAEKIEDYKTFRFFKKMQDDRVNKLSVVLYKIKEL